MSEIHDPETGELPPMKPAIEVAADGRRLAGAASTFSQLVAVLGEGEFDQGMANVLIEFVSDLRNLALASKTETAKGKVSVTLDVKLEGGAFFITPSYKVSLPSLSHARALMWATDDGRFTPNAPLQGQMFGVRDVTAMRVRSA